MTKVIVLDIDGPVINARSNLVHELLGPMMSPTLKGNYDHALLHILRLGCAKTGTRIAVISDRRSDYQQCYTLMCNLGLQGFLHHHWCLPHYLCNNTPANLFNVLANESRQTIVERWCEVTETPIGNVLIVDDAATEYEACRARYIQGTYRDGLCEAELRQVISFFSS